MDNRDEWLKQRLGKVTASRIADLMAKTKSGYSTSRDNYMAQLIVERMTGVVQESYTNAAMQWGVDNEPNAAAAYEFESGNKCELSDFVDHPSIPMCGASPDRTVGDDGLVEMKCPNTATHINTLLGDGIDKKYILQMQWQMECTGRQWCDFVSYDPRMPPELSIKIQRVNRDDDLIDEIKQEVISFLKEVDEKVKQLEELGQ